MNSMVSLSAKKVVCITGSLWTHKHDAPRHLLVKEGFMRPRWFTTGRALHDADYKAISKTSFQLAQAESSVLAFMKYGQVFTGILKDDFQKALEESDSGVLVVGFPEVIAQVAENYLQAKVFAFKPEGSDLSESLDPANKRGQLHRIDIDVLETGAWDEVMAEIKAAIT